MKIRPKIRNAALLGALAAVAATAWATNESLSYTTPYEPASQAAVASPAMTRSDAVAPIESLSPSESVVSPSEAPAPAAPVADRSMPQTPVAAADISQPGITIEERRLTVDQRIQADVMERIAGMQNVSGKIGVESNEAVVTLTGYTSTAGQAYRVGREARAVIGVRYVDNQIRPRIGGSV